MGLSVMSASWRSAIVVVLEDNRTLSERGCSVR